MPADFARPVVVTVFAVLLCRALPAFAFALASRRVGGGAKLAAALLYAALAAWVARLEPAHLDRFLTLGAASAYWALAAAALFALARAGVWARLPGWLTFSVLAVAWVGAPAWPLRGADRAAVVLVGVEGLLSAYSAARVGRSLPSLRECLFFVLVDPTLVFAQRARPDAEPSLAPRHAHRLLLGAAAVAAGVALALAAGRVGAPAAGAAGRVAGLCALAALLGAAFYAGHSGVASMQIALLAMLGFRAGERYLFPLASTGPRDFWRRWNVYLGRWLRDYVYVPAARRLARRLPRPAAHALATLAAFGACGALHGGVQYAIYGVLPWPAVVAFVAQGAALLAWNAAEQRVHARANSGARRLATRELSRALFVPFCLAMLLWLYPALSGGGRPSTALGEGAPVAPRASMTSGQGSTFAHTPAPRAIGTAVESALRLPKLGRNVSAGAARV